MTPEEFRKALDAPFEGHEAREAARFDEVDAKLQALENGLADLLARLDSLITKVDTAI